MTTGDYKSALELARAELRDILKRRAELDQRILKLQSSIKGLAALCDETDDSEGLLPSDLSTESDDRGISDTIRDILKVSAVPLSVPDIRNELTKQGFDETEYKNFLTAIHNTLGRLAKQGEVERVTIPGGPFGGGSLGWTIASKPSPGKAEDKK